MSLRLEGVLPYWLDRPDEEALEIAVEVRRAGLGTLWIGEMATFDAVALATAVGHRTEGLRLKIGPLAIGVRTPVSISLALASVATLTGSDVDVALGASSPVIVSGWHDRPWAHAAPRMRETIECLRTILAGERADYDGRHVRAHGFRLRRARPQTCISVAAFGPAMTRVAARHADEVVLNLVPPSHVRAVRATVDAEAAAAGRKAPGLAVWVPVALDPGGEAHAQLAAQLALYLAPPGYGEMFSQLGFSDLVRRARDGARRSELAASVPFELLELVCAVGSREDVAGRISAYRDAGADVVGVVPATAEDPGGRQALTALSERFVQLPESETPASSSSLYEPWISGTT
jgi:probable F420-dependent oxidoreductase